MRTGLGRASGPAPVTGAAPAHHLGGQIDAVERSVIEGDECAGILMLLAAIRGGVNGLMAEVLENHIRLHIAHPERARESSEELTEDLVSLVRACLK